MCPSPGLPHVTPPDCPARLSPDPHDRPAPKALTGPDIAPKMGQAFCYWRLPELSELQLVRSVMAATVAVHQ